MKTLLTAVTLASGLISAPVFAQNSNMTMDISLSMLELAADRELAQHGYRGFDVMSLTLNQLAKIKYVSSASDYNDNERTRQIGQIIGAN